MHEYNSDEDEEAVAFRERLRKLAEESPATGNRHNTRSMELKIYGVDMSLPATESPMMQAAAGTSVLDDDEELAKALARATKLLAEARAANERAAMPKPSMVASREAAATVGRKSTLPPPGLASPARNSLAPPPGLVAESKWNKYYDSEHKAAYWHCPSTGETTWIKPVDEQKPSVAVSEAIEKRPSIVGGRRTSAVPETIPEERRKSIVEERRSSTVPEVEKRKSIVEERSTSAVVPEVETRKSIVQERRTSAVLPGSRKVSVVDRRTSIASVTTTTAALAASRRTSLATIDTDRRSSIATTTTTFGGDDDEDKPLQVDESITKKPQNLAILGFVFALIFIYLCIVRL